MESSRGIRGELQDITALGRPLDPGYPTNRAVLVLLPVALLGAGTVAALEGDGTTAVLASAVSGALAAFGSWAVAREVAPDDEIMGAFLAMALGFAACLVFDVALLPLFAALFFARVVGRPTGLAATGVDSLLVTAFALFVAWRLGSPWPAVAGAAAFALDAVLAPTLARQWVFAGVCTAGAVGLVTAGLAPDVVPVQPGLVPRTVATILVVGSIALIVATRSVAARGDATGEPLSVARVRGAQGTVLLMALAVSASGTAGVEAAGAVWATLVGVILPAAVREAGVGRNRGIAGSDAPP